MGLPGRKMKHQAEMNELKMFQNVKKEVKR